jgi:hypothetical protein
MGSTSAAEMHIDSCLGVQILNHEGIITVDCLLIQGQPKQLTLANTICVSSTQYTQAHGRSDGD